MGVIQRIRSILIDDFDNHFARTESIRVRQWDCRANLPACPTRGQGLYEAKHGLKAMPFERLPAHVRDAYHAMAEGPCGYAFRGNNSAYRTGKRP